MRRWRLWYSRKLPIGSRNNWEFQRSSAQKSFMIPLLCTSFGMPQVVTDAQGCSQLIFSRRQSVCSLLFHLTSWHFFGTLKIFLKILGRWQLPGCPPWLRAWRRPSLLFCAGRHPLYFRSECCITWKIRAWTFSFHPPKAPCDFQVFGVAWLRIERILPGLMARAKPTVALSRKICIPCAKYLISAHRALSRK